LVLLLALTILGKFTDKFCDLINVILEKINYITSNKRIKDFLILSTNVVLLVKWHKNIVYFIIALEKSAPLYIIMHFLSVKGIIIINF